MPESESGALPFGDSPIYTLIAEEYLSYRWYYNTSMEKLQVLFEIFFKNFFIPVFLLIGLFSTLLPQYNYAPL